NSTDKPKPQLLPAKKWSETSYQVNTSLHHCRGMQISTYRGRRFHCIRQPNMKRKLTGLRKSPEKQKNHCRSKKHMITILPERSDNFTNAKCFCHDKYHNETHKHRHSPTNSDKQRL